MSRTIKFPLGIETLEEWGEWEKRLALVVVLSFLLSPRSGSMREKLRTLFYSDLTSKADASTPGAIFAFVYRRRFFEADVIADLSPISDYRSRLDFRLADREPRPRRHAYLRDIATVGLLVKVMASAHGIGKEGRQISTARDYIDQNYDSTSIILRNTDDTSYAWKNWRSVGHLCAAMVDFLQSRADLHFDAAVLSALEEELPTFLANALHYQSFLTGALTIDEVPLSTKVSKNINLRWLPALKFSPLPNSDLPGWGKLIVPRE